MIKDWNYKKIRHISWLCKEDYYQRTYDLIKVMLDQAEKDPNYFKDKIVVDVGCGCGLLGILALKLGAKCVIF